MSKFNRHNAYNKAWGFQFGQLGHNPKKAPRDKCDCGAEKQHGRCPECDVHTCSQCSSKLGVKELIITREGAVWCESCAYPAKA